MHRFVLPVLALSTSFAAGCHRHASQIQYDLGRATSAAFSAQADLTRPSVADSAYILTGTEALEMRQRVTDDATDKESGKAEAVQSIQVQ
jgi:hypothetical protein